MIMLNIVDRTKEIFVGFANREFPNMLMSELWIEAALINKMNDEVEYFKVKRNGRKLALNRVERRALFSLFQNARKHAAFEVVFLAAK
jgi:hypothetical protein